MSDRNRRERGKTLRAAGAVSFAVAVASLYFWMFYDMGASASRYRVEQEQAAQTYSENATREVHAECAGRSDRLTCEREIEQARRQGARDEQDLEAQRGMSKWAFWLLVVSAFQLPATLAALVFVKRTLDATLEAVEDTGLATKAMVRQNELAEAAQRPWLAIELAGREPFIVSPRRFKTSLKLTIKNVGGSPATKVQVMHKCFPIGDKEEGDKFIAKMAEGHSESEWGEILVPQQQTVDRPSIDVEFDEDDLLDVQGRKAFAPAIVIVATYSQVGRADTYQTAVGFLFGGRRDNGVTVIFAEERKMTERESAIAVHPSLSRIT